MRKAVHFGAGNIGRGFIGLLLSQSGFEVSFVVRNEKKTALLQKRRQYPVTVAGETPNEVIVKNVTAIPMKDRQRVAEAIAEADLVTTAVGAGALEAISPWIAEGIALRLERQAPPLHVIACENAIGGSELLKENVMAHLAPSQREALERRVAFPNAAVDRIVPQLHHEDPLAVTVEPFSEWVVDRSTLLEPFPEIKGLQLVESLEPFIERKLFTVNAGHASAAYLGYLEGHRTIQEAMGSPEIRNKIQKLMQETGEMLIRKHDFDKETHQRYIQKIMDRFTNPNLIDTVQRVARSPIRKLSFQDRFVRAAMTAYELGVRVPHLTTAMAAALRFDHAKDPEAVKLQHALKDKGIRHVVRKLMGIPEEHPLFRDIVAKYRMLEKKDNSEVQAV
ncbi:mannitol-1-phosphate 5-dehydrogenase [Paenibacillus sp. TRM 82003]|nr:mannitol-1-phosphate 5-dehydrogenase [Paenibacillus sp. TRM 82003]